MIPVDPERVGFWRHFYETQKVLDIERERTALAVDTAELQARAMALGEVAERTDRARRIFEGLGPS